MSDAKRIAGDTEVRGLDTGLLVIAGLILAIGLVMVASASISLADTTTGDPFYYLTRQLLFAIAGMTAGGLMYYLPLSWWQRSGYLLLVLAFALLVVVLVPGIGRHVNGSIRSVALGPFRLQVSEPARLLIFIYLAGYIVRRSEELSEGLKGFLKPMLLVGVAGLLLLLEPDFGATLVLTATAMGMLFLGGARLRDFALCAGMGGIAFALLVLVLVPGIGRHVNGSIRSVALGPFRLQVSEPARLLIFIYLAGYIVRRREELAAGIKGFLKPMLLVGVAGLLLLLEPDFGATLVLTATAMGMLFLGGARLRDFALCVAAGGAAFTVLAVSSPYRLARLTGFLDPWQDPFAGGFQLTQSLIAIGRGQFFGVGLGESVQKLFYLPEAHTDFLFAVLAEELGLAGSILIIALYLLLTWRAVGIARRAARRAQYFGAYLAFGIGIWIGLQAFINMGVNMGVLPTKGLTLPLMSYGGSSLLVTCAALGLLLRVDRETRDSGKWTAEEADG